MKNSIEDLRSAIEFLKQYPGQCLETDRLVSPKAELTGIYKKLGARGTVARPTHLGPMMLFNSIEGFPGARIVIGVVGTRERIGLALGAEPEHLGKYFRDSLKAPLAPVVIPNEKALCQEQKYLATDPDFDIRRILPAALTTEVDGGPYITMGLCYARDPETGEHNAAIHRMCLQGRDELSIGFGGYRHLGVFRDKAFAKGEPLPLSVNIGLDPAVYMTSCFEPPTTPEGFDELSIAGAMRGKPVELARCVAIDELCIANAEYVIEGELIPDCLIKEDSTTNTGYALPEFPGYRGPARPVPLFRVKAVTCRNNPIMQICIGSSEEHVNMAGIPSEASVLDFLEKAMPGKVLNVYCPPSGGGKFNAIIQLRKRDKSDEGKQRQAALCAFSVMPEVKNIFLVDEDIDIFDPYDMEWAMTTRFRPDKDLVIIPNVPGHLGDPTQKPTYDPQLRFPGLAYKAIYDYTAPFDIKKSFARPVFMDVDISEFE